MHTRNTTGRSRLPMRGKGQEGGFTLVELLVVIAIISLLVSILLPSLNRIKELTRRAVCMANERGILLIMQLYGAENDAWVVLGNGANYWGPITFWGYLEGSGGLGDPAKFVYGKYTGAMNMSEGLDLFRCPSAPALDRSFGPLEQGGFHVSYYTRKWSPYFGTPVRQLAEYPLQHPDDALLSDWFDAHTGFVGFRWHETGYNVGYVDAHVSWYDDSDREVMMNLSYWYLPRQWVDGWKYFDNK